MRFKMLIQWWKKFNILFFIYKYPYLHLFHYISQVFKYFTDTKIFISNKKQWGILLTKEKPFLTTTNKKIGCHH